MLISLRITTKKIIADHSHNINVVNDVLSPLARITKLVGSDLTYHNGQKTHKLLNAGGAIIALKVLLAMLHFIKVIILLIALAFVGHIPTTICWSDIDSFR